MKFTILWMSTAIPFTSGGQDTIQEGKTNRAYNFSNKLFLW